MKFINFLAMIFGLFVIIAAIQWIWSLGGMTAIITVALIIALCYFTYEMIHYGVLKHG